MVTWYYRSVFDELEDMRKYLEVLNQQIYGTTPVALLPAAGGSVVKMLPVQPTIRPVDVSENDDEVVITAGMIAGIAKKNIVLELINSRALEITCVQTDETTQENGGYYHREHTIQSMTRIVPLPEPVTEDGASATFKDGVLEVHLKKIAKGSRGKIPVD
ncbi:Hsp20/alpha crystallin family protein [Methanoregula sp.]|uniref:Hsp20/alpha crystallin family protein n=1 Tax=Methanoregula sp. TaxID=2052170 RepID=UPI002BFB6CAB|nr:Hsp20/alpha crystallin family protein [Methanoregula sp.]HVP95520.1 Hsp20/alpha crystallin family protein [Methanoregula sp.]